MEPVTLRASSSSDGNESDKAAERETSRTTTLPRPLACCSFHHHPSILADLLAVVALTVWRVFPWLAGKLAAALHRAQRRRGGALPSWSFHPRSICCLQIRWLLAICCVLTIGINLALRAAVLRKAAEATTVGEEGHRMTAYAAQSPPPPPPPPP
eukprot:COSAG04_NODE_6882_length_1234_cov_2.071366_1_plen_154_part_10